MSISVFDIRTGNHKYQEGQTYQTFSGPGPGEWFTIRNGREIKILWREYFNHKLHSERIKNHIRKVLDSGALDYGSPGAKETLKELYEWIIKEVKQDV